MQACLEAEDLWGCVLGTPEYITDFKKMSKARANIILAVRKQKYGHIQGTITPREAWNKLNNAFEDRGHMRKVGLLRTLTSTRLEDCTSVEEYVNRITMTAHSLKELDFDVNEEMVGALLLSGLPEEYKPMIMGLESSGTPIIGDALKVKLMQEVKLEAVQSTAGSEAALYTKASKKNAKDKQKRKCFACGKIGHFAAKCRNKQKEDNKDKDDSTHKVFATFAASNEIITKDWYNNNNNKRLVSQFLRLFAHDGQGKLSEKRKTVQKKGYGS